ncbi:hypothetical protein B4N84_28260, partial [Flavobacterium sp. IR1]
MKVKMLKGRTRGQVFEARAMRQYMFESSPSFQLLEGPYMGEVLPYEYGLIIEEKKQNIDWHTLTIGIDSMIAEWVETPFTGSRVENRMEFTKQLTDFIEE